MRIVRSVTLAVIAILGLLAGTASTAFAGGGPVRSTPGRIAPAPRTAEADPGDPGVPPRE